MFDPNNNNKSKDKSFIGQMTSGQQQIQGGSMMNMLSPRNLMKFISNTIDQYNTRPKSYKPEIAVQQQFIQSFQPYWSKIENEFKQYNKNKVHKNGNNQKQEKNQILQFKLKLQRIPQSYFDQKYELFFCQKFNKIALKRKQQEVTEYLDEIQVLLFNKTSKNPQKFFNCIGNFDETISLVRESLQKVKNYRISHHSKLSKLSKRQLQIRKILSKKQRIQTTIDHLLSIKKLKQIKQQSEQSLSTSRSTNASTDLGENHYIEQKLQILLNVKKKQLDTCGKLKSLQKIVGNLQVYREQIKSLVYDQFNQSIIEIMSKILLYDKSSWYNVKINAKMLGKQFQADSNKNLLQQSRLNITILDQSCFGLNQNQFKQSNNMNSFNSSQNNNVFQQKTIPNTENLKGLIEKLTKNWQSIVKFDLYDEQEVNDLIMRQLIRHNVIFNRDLDEYLTKLFDQFNNQSIKTQSVKPILEQQEQNEQDQEKSKQLSSNQQNSQNLQQISQKIETPKKNKYFSAISEFTGINQLKNIKELKDLSHLKKKTINTFKRFGNLKKIGQALNGLSEAEEIIPSEGYCKVKQEQVIQKDNKNKQKTQQKLSKVDIKFFLKAVRFYYQIISALIKFIKLNPQLTFFHNFQQKLFKFIEQRARFFFSLRQISQKTPVNDFLHYLNLIEYWLDVQQQVYQNLSKLKQTITDEYLTSLQKNVLVNQLKQSIDNSTYFPLAINSTHINSFYYVFFWTLIQSSSHDEINNMSLTILKDENINILEHQSQQNAKLIDIKNFQRQLKIVDKRIIFKKSQFLITQSFIILLKQLQKYLQLREVLTQFNSNIQQKLCEVIGFYVWYNLKNINKTGPSIKPRTLRNLCVIYSTISFLKIIFTEQLQITNKKYAKTLGQFDQFFKNIENNITMTPFLLIQQQISMIYQSNAMNSQFQIPCKETIKILEIIKLSLEELKIHFNKEKIIKIFQPSIKIIIKNYVGYLSSLGKRGLLQLKDFIPKLKDLLLNYGFKQDIQIKQNNQLNQKSTQTHIFLKQIIEIEKKYKQKISQFKELK